MAANVRCAGGGDYRNGESCGWRGERFRQAWVRFKSQTWEEAEDDARTVKPCPRCGGAVKIIPREGLK
jgi:hypothetical protein